MIEMYFQVRQLLEGGADPNLASELLRTPLMEAARKGFAEVQVVAVAPTDNINFTVILSPMRIFKCGMIFLRFPHTSRAFHAAVDCVRSILPVAATFFIACARVVHTIRRSLLCCWSTEQMRWLGINQGVPH
jgi:hypothetical protein